MGSVIPFRPAHRPTAPETPEDWRDEVTALEAERREMVEAIRPIVARLVVLGVNVHPAVLRQAQDLAAVVERPARRADLGGAA